MTGAIPSYSPNQYAYGIHVASPYTTTSVTLAFQMVTTIGSATLSLQVEGVASSSVVPLTSSGASVSPSVIPLLGDFTVVVATGFDVNTTATYYLMFSRAINTTTTASNAFIRQVQFIPSPVSTSPNPLTPSTTSATITVQQPTTTIRVSTMSDSADVVIDSGVSGTTTTIVDYPTTTTTIVVTAVSGSQRTLVLNWVYNDAAKALAAARDKDQSSSSSESGLGTTVIALIVIGGVFVVFIGAVVAYAMWTGNWGSSSYYHNKNRVEPEATKWRNNIRIQ